MELPQTGANSNNNIIGKGLAWVTATALKTYRASRSLSCVKKYSCITVKNPSTLAGHCELMAVMSRLVDLPRTVRGNALPLNNIGVGDRIVVEQSKYSSCPLSGYYRIEQPIQSVDEKYERR